LQSEVFFAMTYFAETLTDMIDNLHRDYLIERAENMLSIREGQKAEDESRELGLARFNKGPAGPKAVTTLAGNNVEFVRTPRPVPGRPRDEHGEVRREGTTVYPRLSLAVGQRLASKGASLMKLAPDGRLQPASPWLIP
ncbi:MAG: hypothetical protein RL722_2889, partial [Pseudomonadota bacterium]|jgi:hypothetical protein